ncbi:fructokinase [Ureibacillus xyleni]|uniref:Fructokinase n=1 Tax=Ureibacillus xyleni TaxID=614648 RepID=A0A285TKZ1_9BACL|nr:carbohydrate kinase [Ureibacillus xyleni]SOC23338.1 fructokinase [Ureibacillus xyleni]
MTHSILCIGELLIDFFCNERNVNLQQGQTFIKHAGGAPANVCAAIAKLGGVAYFLGKVGADPFGLFLENMLHSLNVHTNFLMKDQNHPTTLAFVSLQENGERDFTFNRGADAHLKMEEISVVSIQSMKMMHFGSATALLPGPLQQTYFELFTLAKKNRCFISFDPNFRGDLWNGQEQLFKDLSLKYISHSDFVKLSEEELVLITGEQEMKKAVTSLHILGARSIAVTLGERGTYFSNHMESKIVPSISINAVDTTGAGDAFVGAVLYQLSKKETPHEIPFDAWLEIITFGNKVGALVCEKMGAIEALPKLEDVVSR